MFNLNIYHNPQRFHDQGVPAISLAPRFWRSDNKRLNSRLQLSVTQQKFDISTREPADAAVEEARWLSLAVMCLGKWLCE